MPALFFRVDDYRSLFLDFESPLVVDFPAAPPVLDDTDVLSVFCILPAVGVLDLALASAMLVPVPDVVGALDDPLGVVMLEPVPLLPEDIPVVRDEPVAVVPARPVAPALAPPAAEDVVLVFFSSSVNLRSISSKAYFNITISASFSLYLLFNCSIISK